MHTETPTHRSPDSRTKDAPPPLPTPRELLAASKATAEFAESVLRLAESGKADARIRYNLGAPPVKVFRAVLGLLEGFPEVEIDSIHVDAKSGCSDFRGTLTVQPSGRKFAFVWDCHWRAQQLGWKDAVGDVDQARAAREYGYRCFVDLHEVK